MPGWHDATKQLQEEGKIAMVGIVQEQNPDRARLFMQWREMDWPILVDTFDFLEIAVVPLTFAIDEYGIIRAKGLRLSDAATIEETFVSKTYEATPALEPRVTNDSLAQRAPRAALGDQPMIESVISGYGETVEAEPSDGWAHFRLAAGYRLRYDSPARLPGDFQSAIDSWQRALELDPNNYIWRRRLQQYGPRLDKPYPFYDWIEEAREQISARGDTPAALVSEPTGSEIAQPSKVGVTAQRGPEVMEPDPKARVFRDGTETVKTVNGGKGTAERLIEIETVAVPRRIEAGGVARLHFVFRPNEAVLAHWNNEVDPLQLWINTPPGWQVASRQILFPNADTAVSTEPRTLEIELQAPASVRKETRVQVPGYALYYVCEDRDGTCLYRRQDVAVEMVVTPAP